MPSLALYVGLQPALSGVNQQYLVVLGILSFVVPLGVLLSQVAGALAGLERLVALLLAVAVPLTLSVIVNIDNYTATPLLVVGSRIVALSLYVTTVGLILQHDDGEALLQRAFTVMALVLAALFVFSALTAPAWFWGRFKPGAMHPNWWGEVLSAVVFGAAFLQRPALLRYALWVVALVGLVLVQSRASLVMSVAVIAVTLVITEPPRRLLVLGMLTLFLLPLGFGVDAVVSERPLAQRLNDFVASDVLLLDDPYRGLGTGASGREDGWIFALETIMANPFFGVGAAYTDRLATVAGEDLIHNGHLSLIADLGFVLVLPIYILLLGGIVLGIRKKLWRETAYIAVFVLFFTMFSPRIINASVNPMLLWMLVSVVWLKAHVSANHHSAPRELTTRQRGQRRIGDRWPRGTLASPQ